MMLWNMYHHRLHPCQEEIYCLLFCQLSVYGYAPGATALCQYLLSSCFSEQGQLFRSVDINHTQASRHTRPLTNTPTQTIYPLMLLMMMRFVFVHTTGDRLLEVDGFDLRAVNHHQAVECLKRTGEVYTRAVVQHKHIFFLADRTAISL